MVFCTYCGQSFTRDEHLERHILTHTNVKPFKCFTCHMSFARRDLLQRHYTVHGKDQNNQEIVPAANGMIPRSAGRTPIACSNCAKTKTKCDKKFPCSRCAARNLRCTLRPTRRAAKNAVRIGVSPERGGVVPPGSQATVGETEKETELQDVVNPEQLSKMDKSPSPVVQATNEVDEKPALPTIDISPAQLFERSASATNLSRPSVISTPPTASPSHLVQSTPLSNFEDLSGVAQDSPDNGASPRFMLDWSQMQIPLGFDDSVEPQMLMTPEMNFDPAVLPLAPSVNGMLSILPDLGHGLAPPLITPPMEMPKLERGFSHVDFQENPISRRLRQASSSAKSAAPQGDVRGEMAAIVAARDAWTCFRCTPTLPSISCPKTARLNLERLEQTLKNHDGWSTWSPQWDETEFAGGDHLTVMQLHESTRDKLLAITQTFLHKALEIHRDGAVSPENGGPFVASSGVSNFVLLPPARVLEYFLRSYANCFEQYYPLTSRGILDANELMHCYNDRAASLLVLMMIAQGAMNIPSVEARMLTGGLTEACRISLFDLIEKNITMAGDSIVLHSALIFTVQAAWSGDKWQMDIAMGQRGMYFAMLRHSGVLDVRANQSSVQDPRFNTDHLWNDWNQQEGRSRLVYSWAMVDQELSLFHDTAPLFAVAEFSAPMPDTDRLWHAKNAAEWSSIFEHVHEFSSGYSSIGSGARPMSLHRLFSHFLDDDLVSLGIEMTPLQLRLLLHPLQSLVCQCNQLLSCFTDSISKRNKDLQAMTAASTRGRLGEIQALLQRWFDLAERYLKVNPICPMMQTNLAFFHLISLNAVTDFPSIERLARRDNVEGGYQQLLWLHKRCITDIEEAVFHCGQILRLVRSMPRGIRPPWWAGAVYRVTLVLWIDSLNRTDAISPQNNGMFPVPGPSFAIDSLQADHPLVIRYLTKREGVPCVTRRDGSQMSIDNPFQILQHSIDVIDEGAATRFSDGIRAKLERLARS